MEEIVLSDLNLYENNDHLYIGHGDGFLSRIEGEDVVYIKQILTILLDNENKLNKDQLFDFISKENQIEQDYLNSLVEWLKSNGIVYFSQNDEEKEEQNLNVFLLGLLETDKDPLIEDLNRLLKDSHFQLKSINEYSGDIDFCLIFSPILNKSLNQGIFNDLYEKNIPHVYVDYAPFSATLGPAVNPSLKMHCMTCFFNRRISNTVNPNLYLRLIRLDNKQFRQISILKSSIYNTLIEWLSNELLRLLNSDWEDGGILGKSKTVNFITDEFDVARILKTVGCKTCNERHIYRPLNG